MILSLSFSATICLVASAGYLSWYFWMAQGLVKRNKAAAPDDASLPYVSLLVACRNEEENIEALMDSIIQQDYPSSHLEMIFINDHSEDNTAKMIRGFMDRHHDWNIKLIQQTDITGKKAALQKGLSMASGAWCLHTDADVTMDTCWIRSMISGFVNDDVHMVLGPVFLEKTETQVGCFQYLEVMGLQAVTAATAGQGAPFIANGANLLVRTETARELQSDIRGKNRASGDDVFLLHALVEKRGSRAVVYASDTGACVRTKAEKNLKDMLRQRIRWASKAFTYRNTSAVAHTILMAFILAAFWMLILASLCFNETIIFLCILYISKAWADFNMLRWSATLSGGNICMPAFLLTQLLYPFYATFVGCLSLSRGYTWKGRSTR